MDWKAFRRTFLFVLIVGGFCYYRFRFGGK